MGNDEVHPGSRSEWRRWLEDNHDRSAGVWLVLDKKASGKSTLTYEDAVQEALSFGWIDSVRRPTDGERYKQRFSPRKKSSTWSASNKARVERLLGEGLMAPAGMAKIE